MSSTDKTEAPFTKWTDKATNLSPFLPVEFKPEPLSFPWKHLRPIISVLFLITRTPCVLSTFWMGLVLHTLKYVLLIPYLIRKAE